MVSAITIAPTRTVMATPPTRQSISTKPELTFEALRGPSKKINNLTEKSMEILTFT